MIFKPRLAASCLILFGGMPKGVRPLITGNIHLGTTFLSLSRIPVIAGGLLLMFLLFLFVQRTRFGLAIRALQQDQEAASLQGMNISNTRIIVWVIACCLTAAAGVLLAPIAYVDPFMGSGLLLKGFAVVIMGGLGSIPGAMIGGVALGLVDSFGMTYLGTASYMFAFGFIMVVLILRPQGILGKR